MRTFLVTMMSLLLAGCRDKRDEAQVAAALLSVRMAAWHVVMNRADANRKDATAADGVEYARALENLAVAERTAAEKLATDEEIRIQRQLGETGGKEHAAEMEQFRRKLDREAGN